MGAVGLVFGLAWNRLVYEPADHPLANAAEVDYIRRGGGLVDLDRGGTAAPAARPGLVLELLQQRMLLGIFLGQYCINVLTWFFLTWFPIYLVKQRGMSILQVGFVAVLPALCGFIGGILGGWISDTLLRRGVPLSAARKVPIVAGLLLSTAIVGCNYVVGAVGGDRAHEPGLLRQGRRRARLGGDGGRRAEAKRPASPAACSTPSATSPASSRRSSSATSCRAPARSKARSSTSARTRCSRW